MHGGAIPGPRTPEGDRAVPADAVEAGRAVQSNAGSAESESPTLAGAAGADRWV